MTLVRQKSILDIIPPCLLMYTTADLLPHLTKACLPFRSSLKAIKACFIASHSSQFIGRDLYDRDHIPDAILSFMWAPHLSLDAPVGTRDSVLNGTRIWPDITSEGRAHDQSWNLSSGDTLILCESNHHFLFHLLWKLICNLGLRCSLPHGTCESVEVSREPI